MKIKTIFFLLFLLTGCTVCTVGPKYIPPCLEVPEQWSSPLSEGMDLGRKECFLWLGSLNDPILTSLIERASLQNLDLHLAASRVLEARAEHKGGTSALLPHIDAAVGYEHVQYNRNRMNSLLGTALKRNHIDFFEAGFDADWELDLFGMHAHEINALQAKIEASQEDFCHLWITLGAEIARNYIELRGAQLRLAVIEKNILAQEENMEMTNALTDQGFSSSIAQMQASEQLHVLKAEKPQIELSIKKTIHRLSILLGYSPGELLCELEQPYPLPIIPYSKPMCIPSELLRRRPDVKKAERDFAAANEQVGVAVASMFPRLSLHGFIGDIVSICSGNGYALLGGSQLLFPLFNSRLIKQDVNLNNVKSHQALYEYQKTVLKALEETENAIASYHYEAERNDHLRDALKASQDAYELTLNLYQKGFKNYLEVLAIHRTFLTAEASFIQSQCELLFQYIALYKALGGGWDITVETCEEGA